MIITREQVKTYLGITVPDYDAQIDLYLPIIDSKVKQITGHRWNDFFYGNTKGNEYIEIVDFKGETLEAGAQISGQGIADGSYIVEVYTEAPPIEVGAESYSVPLIQLNQATTSTKNSEQIFIGFPIAYLPLVAKAVWWMIDQQNTNAPTVGSGVASRTRGKVSVTFNEANSKIDGKHGVPSWFVTGLPKYHRGM